MARASRDDYMSIRHLGGIRAVRGAVHQRTDAGVQRGARNMLLEGVCHLAKPCQQASSPSNAVVEPNARPGKDLAST